MLFLHLHNGTCFKSDLRFLHSFRDAVPEKFRPHASGNPGAKIAVRPPIFPFNRTRGPEGAFHEQEIFSPGEPHSRSRCRV